MRNNASSPLAGTLFGGLFLVMGLGFLIGMVGHPLSDYLAARHWQPMQATILSSELKSYRGDDSTTYKAIASYRYFVGDRSYQGSQVSVQDIADNFGDYQQTMAAKLSRAQRSGEPVPGWVNPDNPHQALLDRELRWTLVVFPTLLCSVFVVIGGGIVYISWRKQAATDAQSETGDQPWLVKPEWQASGILSQNRLALWGWWIGVLFMSALLVPLLWQMPGALKKGEYGILFGLPFVAIGLLVLFKAVQRTLEARRFGRAPVVLTPFPGQIGGVVAGYIDVALPMDRQHRFTVTLEQMKTVVRRSGNKTETSTSSVWELSAPGQLNHCTRGTRVAFSFAVPEGMPPSKTQGGSGYWWSLKVRGDIPGVDFNRSYEIPVFAHHQSGAAHRSAAAPTAAVTAPTVSAPSDFRPQLQRLLDIEQQRDSITISQASGSHPMGWPITLFGALFVAIGIGVGIALPEAALIIPIVFSGMGALFAAIGISLLATGYHTVIDREEILHETRRFGRASQGQCWPLTQAKALNIVQGGSSSSGRKTTEYFQLKLALTDGSSITMAHGIAGRQAALQLQSMIMQQAGIPAESLSMKAS